MGLRIKRLKHSFISDRYTRFDEQSGKRPYVSLSRVLTGQHPNDLQPVSALHRLAKLAESSIRPKTSAFSKHNNYFSLKKYDFKKMRSIWCTYLKCTTKFNKYKFPEVKLFDIPSALYMINIKYCYTFFIEWTFRNFKTKIYNYSIAFGIISILS